MTTKTAKPSWHPGSQPTIRSNPEGMACPYCGVRTLVLSKGGDHPEDDIQIQMYCKNSECSAREIRIVADVRSDGPERADVLALMWVDEGRYRHPSCLREAEPAFRLPPGSMADEMRELEIAEREQHVLRRRSIDPTITCQCDYCTGKWAKLPDADADA
jgi:hypothetical protein